MFQEKFLILYHINSSLLLIYMIFLSLFAVDRSDLILDTVDDNSEQCMPLLKKFANARYITLKTPFLRNNDESTFPLGIIKTGVTLGAHNIKVCDAVLSMSPTAPN